MKRRDFNIGAVLALLTTGFGSMTPENERKAVAALERIASALEDLARKADRRSGFGQAMLDEADRLLPSGLADPGNGPNSSRRG